MPISAEKTPTGKQLYNTISKPRLYTPCHRVIQRIDSLSIAVGQSIAWLTVIMVVLVALIVCLRTFFNVGSIALQESVTYLHATVLMLCLGYNLQQGGHVRVDVFYCRFNRVQKSWVNAVGGIVFLAPFALFLFFVSIDFVANAWAIKETSANPGGLALVFVLKTLIPIGGLLLALQALSDILRALLALSFADEHETHDAPHTVF